MRRANPEGSPNLEHDAESYAPELDRPMWWENRRHAVFWYPVLALCRRPIVDLGCGPGDFAAMAFKLGFDYRLGVDFSQIVIDLAQLRCPRGQFICHDIRRHPHKSADRTVTLVEVLEHVYDDLDVMRAILPGTEVVLTVPNFWTEGHCRWFCNLEQVRDRYQPLLHIDYAMMEVCGKNDRHRFFLVRGIRQ